MSEKGFRKINIVTGWVTLFISLMVYGLTVEPTVSFWDCGEFIAAAYKMLVGHPPGAPLFLMIGRVFSLFAMGDTLKVALMVNMISVLSSAITIMFLYWTIVHLAKKIFVSYDDDLTTGQAIAVIGSGLVGALAYTFSDTLWFSAVEGEVYAMSSMVTAIVFWAILKWERYADKPYADRWIIMIAYVIGLSIGIHLLNLLAIPAIVFTIYFRKYKVTKLGLFKTLIVSFAVLIFVQYGVIPGIPNLGAKFELLFVNSFGLPFWSGFIFYTFLIIACITWGIFYSIKKENAILNTAIWCLTFIILGYVSYAAIVIRSNANPPMDENNPEDVFSLLSYLNREQYGDRPLFKGPYFTARVIDTEEGEMRYIKGDEKYLEAGRKPSHIFDPKHTTVFPRCWDGLDESHASFYRSWLGLKEGQKPTFADNMDFLFSYQLNWMYFRYFMWNFVGRQNDVQGHGDVKDGNWLFGIDFLDSIRLGRQDNIPERMRNDRSRNELYGLPLILGLLGMFFHINRHKGDSFIVMLLFILTGIAIVLYLNQTPLQPRERDYAYAGSFYAFAIWIGLGVLPIYEWLKKRIPDTQSGIIVTLICMIVPAIMAAEEWDDHDRSNTFTARDSAHNYLNSCDKNSILFTNGDNDTFPLWYIQEVEGVRTDVRVCNLSLLSTDWYIDQMKRKAYDSDPIPFSLTKEKYVQGTRDYVPFYDKNLKGFTNIKDVVDFIASDNPKTRARTQGGELVDYFPTKNLRVPVDADRVIANGIVKEEDRDKIVPYIDWTLNKNGLYKADMMILDLLAYNNWKRPVYFAITVSNRSYLNLQDYFQLEGLSYKLVPIMQKTRQGQVERVNVEAMYDNLMNKFKWGGMQGDIYMNENNLRMTSNFRHNFIRLAEAYILENNKEKAIEVLDRCIEVMPHKTVPYNVFVVRVADLYYEAGVPEKSDDLIKIMADYYEENIMYYLSLDEPFQKSYKGDLRQELSIFQELYRLAKVNKRDELATNLEGRMRSFPVKGME